MQLENLEIPISESDLELLRLIKKKSAFLQLKNLGPIKK